MSKSNKVSDARNTCREVLCEVLREVFLVKKSFILRPEKLHAKLHTKLHTQLHTQLHTKLHAKLHTKLHTKLHAKLHAKLHTKLHAQLHHTQFAYTSTNMFQQGMVSDKRVAMGCCLGACGEHTHTPLVRKRSKYKKSTLGPRRP
jgi:hypothetical protein